MTINSSETSHGDTFRVCCKSAVFTSGKQVDDKSDTCCKRSSYFITLVVAAFLVFTAGVYFGFATKLTTTTTAPKFKTSALLVSISVIYQETYDENKISGAYKNIARNIVTALDTDGKVVRDGIEGIKFSKDSLTLSFDVFYSADLETFNLQQLASDINIVLDYSRVNFDNMATIKIGKVYQLLLFDEEHTPTASPLTYDALNIPETSQIKRSPIIIPKPLTTKAETEKALLIQPVVQMSLMKASIAAIYQENYDESKISDTYKNIAVNIVTVLKTIKIVVRGDTEGIKYSGTLLKLNFEVLFLANLKTFDMSLLANEIKKLLDDNKVNSDFLVTIKIEKINKVQPTKNDLTYTRQNPNPNLNSLKPKPKNERTNVKVAKAVAQIQKREPRSPPPPPPKRKNKPPPPPPPIMEASSPPPPPLRMTASSLPPPPSPGMTVLPSPPTPGVTASSLQKVWAINLNTAKATGFWLDKERKNRALEPNEVIARCPDLERKKNQDTTKPFVRKSKSQTVKDIEKILGDSRTRSAQIFMKTFVKGTGTHRIDKYYAEMEINGEEADILLNIIPSPRESEKLKNLTIDDSENLLYFMQNLDPSLAIEIGCVLSNEELSSAAEHINQHCPELKDFYDRNPTDQVKDLLIAIRNQANKTKTRALTAFDMSSLDVFSGSKAKLYKPLILETLPDDDIQSIRRSLHYHGAKEIKTIVAFENKLNEAFYEMEKLKCTDKAYIEINKVAKANLMSFEFAFEQMVKRFGGTPNRINGKETYLEPLRKFLDL